MDKKYQGKGYGLKASNLFLKYVKTMPMEMAEKIGKISIIKQCLEKYMCSLLWWRIRIDIVYNNVSNSNKLQSTEYEEKS